MSSSTLPNQTEAGHCNPKVDQFETDLRGIQYSIVWHFGIVFLFKPMMSEERFN